MSGMLPDRAKVIDGLCHLRDDLAVHKSDCGNCPYNPATALKWPYGCIAGQIKVLEDAIRFLQEED